MPLNADRPSKPRSRAGRPLAAAAVVIAIVLATVTIIRVSGRSSSAPAAPTPAGTATSTLAGTATSAPFPTSAASVTPAPAPSTTTPDSPVASSPSGTQSTSLSGPGGIAYDTTVPRMATSVTAACAHRTGPVAAMAFEHSSPTGLTAPLEIDRQKLYIAGGPPGSGVLCRATQELTGALSPTSAIEPESGPIAYLIQTGEIWGAVAPGVFRVEVGFYGDAFNPETFTVTPQSSYSALMSDLGNGWHAFNPETGFSGSNTLQVRAYDRAGKLVGARQLGPDPADSDAHITPTATVTRTSSPGACDEWGGPVRVGIAFGAAGKVPTDVAFYAAKTATPEKLPQICVMLENPASPNDGWGGHRLLNAGGAMPFRGQQSTPGRQWIYGAVTAGVAKVVIDLAGSAPITVDTRLPAAHLGSLALFAIVLPTGSIAHRATAFDAAGTSVAVRDFPSHQ